MGAPARIILVLREESLNKGLGERVTVLQAPPEIAAAVDALHDFGAEFLVLERRQIGDDQLHALQYAELLGLLGRGNGVGPKRDVDEHVGAAVGDVEQRRTIVGGAERHDFLADLLPALLLREFGETVIDRVAIGVVRHQEGGLDVLAERRCNDRGERFRRHVGILLRPESVTLAVLAGHVVRSGDADHVEDFFAGAELFKRDRAGARDRA